MRIILLYILLALLGQQTTFLETENLKTSKSEKVLKIFQVFNFSDSQIQKDSQVFSFSDSQIQYYESQIRLADSLYKNYLPQYNFEEVKAAMMFFDSCEQRAMSNETFLESENLKTSEFEKGLRANDKGLKSESRKDAKSQSDCLYDSATLRPYDPATAYRMSVDCCPLSVDIEYQRARAHYYHAVGLTERDDIVGACEHYFIALEIMEFETENLKTSKSEKRLKISQFFSFSDSQILNNPEDYEKIRFLSLIYTRLGELFLSENYCDLAITKYRKALKYVNLLGNNDYKSQMFKFLGNSYQHTDKHDSALYYYNESLKYNSGLINRLDVEKCIALILFYEGERDSAYVILKNNLREIDNGTLKYSYHCTLGDMYYSDRKYDSALYYLETSLDNDIVTKKVAFTTKLSAIYDSLGDYDKRDYYDNFSVKMFLNHANKEVDNKQLKVLYDNYNERKNEREKSIAKVRTRKLIIAISLGVFVILVPFTIFLKYRNKRHIDKLTEKIDDYANENKQLAEDFQKASSKKDKIIKQQKKEIEDIKNELNKKNRVDLDAYYDSDICKKITARKDSDFSCLKEDELALLLKSADTHLNNISTRLYEQFPTLNTNDIYTICLIILNVEKNKFPYLLSRDRKTIYDRFSKIRKLMNIDTKQDLFIHIKDNYLR